MTSPALQRRAFHLVVWLAGKPDGQLHKEHDNPTIGIILCKSKNKTIAEYALRNVNTPIAVSTHKLPKQLQENLPTAEQLEMELEAAVKELGDDQPDEP